MLTPQKERFLTGKKVLIGIGTKQVRDIVIVMARDMGASDVRFGNSEDALGHLEKFQPDLVFGEFTMAPIDGVSFCIALRKVLKGPVPIVILVSNQDDDGHNKSKRAGATETITMPFAMNDLLAGSRKALESGHNTAPTGLRFGPRPTLPPKT
jgi:DNA-binding response OmpR family regulator